MARVLVMRLFHVRTICVVLSMAIAEVLSIIAVQAVRTVHVFAMPQLRAKSTCVVPNMVIAATRQSIAGLNP